jgi:hypothetical protein
MSNFDKEIRIIYKDDATGERAERTAEAITKRLGALARASKTVGGKMREARDDAKEFTDELEKLKRQEALARLKAGSEEYTKAAQAARNASRELAASLRPVVTVQDKLNASIAKMKAAEALAKAKLVSEEFAKAQKESKAATAALAAAQKPVITNQEKLNAEIKKTREAAALDKMRAGSAQFAAAQQEAAEASEALRKSLEGVETVQDQVNAKVAAMREERSIAEATLRSKEFRAEKKKQAAIERELETIGKTRQERIAETLEGFENLTGAIDLAVMAGEAFWATWNAGVAGADLGATAANFKAIADEAAGTSAIVGRGAATRSALRGRSLGLSAGTGRSVASFAEAAARRQVSLEGGDFRELVASFTTQFQDEIATGKLGSAFQALGVDSASTELAIRNQARALGVSADSMSAAAKEAVLLSQGTLAASTAFGAFEVGAAKTQAGIKSFLEQTAQDIATAFTKAAGGVSESVEEQLRDLRARRKEETERRVDLFQTRDEFTEGVKGLAFRQGTGAASGKTFLREDTAEQRAAAGIVRGRIRKNILENSKTVRLIQTRINQLEAQQERKRSAAITTGLEPALVAQAEQLEQATASGSDELSSLAAAFDEVGKARAANNKERLKELAEVIGTFEGITSEQAKAIVQTVRGNDLQKMSNTFNAQALKIKKDALLARSVESRRVLSINKGLSKASRIEKARLAAQQEFQANLADQATSYDDFQNKLGDETTIRRGLIAEQKAQVDVELQFKSGLNESQLEALKLRQRVAQVADEVSRSTETTNEFNRELGRVILSHTFGAGVEAAERLNVKIGDAKIGLGGVLNVAERLVGALNEASGGKLLSDALKPAKKEAEKKPRGGRGGRGGDGGRGDLLARAELAGKGDISRRLIAVQRQLAKDVKTARGDETLLAAAFGISKAETDKLQKQIWENAKKAGQEIRDAAKAERQRLRDEQVRINEEQAVDARNAIRTSGMSEVDQRRALARDAAKREFEERMAQAKGNSVRELEARLDFNDAMFELDVEAARAREELKAQERENELAESKAFWGGVRQTKADMLRDTLGPIAGFTSFSDDFASTLKQEAQAAADAKADAQDAAFAARGSDEKAQRFRASFEYDEETQATIDAFKGMELALNELGAASDVVINNLDMMAQGEMTAAEAATGSTTAILGAVGRTTKGVVKDKKAQAFVMGGFELAQALSSTAEAIINPVFWPKAAAHYASSAQFFALGGGGSKATLKKTGGGGAGSRSRDRQRSRTSQTGGGGLPLRRQQQTGTVLNIFVDPLSGQAIVREANGAVSKDASLKFDKRLSKNSVTRTEL